jgi:hypothetical protein
VDRSVEMKKSISCVGERFNTLEILQARVETKDKITKFIIFRSRRNTRPVTGFQACIQQRDHLLNLDRGNVNT